MGFLKLGTPLPWNKSLKHVKYVREHGVEQLIHIYNNVKSRKGDCLKWGDEVEYHLIRFEGSGASRTTTIHLIAPAVLRRLEAEEDAKPFPVRTAWHPEFGRWMVEATPGRPYGDKTSDLLAVEESMATRRMRMRAALPPGTIPASLTAFPSLGVTGRTFTTPPLPVGGRYSRSPYIPDEIISPHPRFGTLTANIRRRRGAHVLSLVPLLGGEGATTGPRESDARAMAEAAAASIAALGAQALSDDGDDPAPTDDGATASGSAEESQPAQPVPAPTDDGATASGSADTLLAQPVPAMAAAAEHEVLAEMQQAAADTLLAAGGDSSAGAGASASAAAGASVVVPGSAGRPVDMPPSWLPLESHVHMDAMAFGMGCCCLQVTFQATDVAQSRRLYDSLAVLAPLMLALSAATPVLRGRLVDTDTRWGVICDSVDSRTPAERGATGCCTSTLAGASAAGTVASTAVAKAVAIAACACDGSEADQGASQLSGKAGAVFSSTDDTDAAMLTLPASSARSRHLAAPAYDPADTSSGCAGEEPRGDSTGAASSPRWLRHEHAANSTAAAHRRLPKSRYSSVDTYISPRSEVPAALSDLPLPKDEAAEARLREAGLDEALAAHVASLFVRDPVSIFSERVSSVDDRTEPDHWENLQSTNWRSMRWKPPPPDAPGIGWRVELRTMEVQATDFANAALTVTAALFSRVILFFDLYLLLPLSLVDANMVTARRRNAAQFGRFFFRKGVATLPEQCGKLAAAPESASAEAEDLVAEDGLSGVRAGVPWELMSLETVLMGAKALRTSSAPTAAAGAGDAGASAGASSGSGTGAEEEEEEEAWPGLIPLCFAYLELIGCTGAARERVESYLRFVAGRARGEVPTDAQWMRRFIAKHPAYSGGNVVPDVVLHDLLAALDGVEGGSVASAPTGAATGDAGDAAAAAAGDAAAAAGGDSADSGSGNGRSVDAHAAAAAAGVTLDPETIARELLGPVAAAARVRGGASAAAAAGVAAGSAGNDRAIEEAAAARKAADEAAKRLRGSSFVEEVKSATACAQVRRLVGSHTINAQGGKKDFATTPSFLPSLPM